MPDTDTAFVPQLGESVEYRTYSSGTEWKRGTALATTKAEYTTPDRVSHVWVSDPDPASFTTFGEIRRVYGSREDSALLQDTADDVTGRWVSLENIRRVSDPEATDREAELQAEVNRLQALNANQARTISVAHDVIRAIGNATAETADRREWCGEYEQHLEALFDTLPTEGGFDQTFREAASREREYTVYFSGSISVMASSRDDARDRAWDDDSAPDSYRFEITDVSEA
jgi:hypothetical protein